MVEGFRGADKHLLRVAAAQRTGAAERQVIDHRNAPALSSAVVGGDRCGSAGTDHDRIVGLTPLREDGRSLDRRWFYAGGRKLPDYADVSKPVMSQNITPDPGDGIGRWSDAEIKQAITTGIRPDGTRLARTMPYDWYRGIAPADLNALVAFLRTVKPLKNPAIAVKLPTSRAFFLNRSMTAPETVASTGESPSRCERYRITLASVRRALRQGRGWIWCREVQSVYSRSSSRSVQPCSGRSPTSGSSAPILVRFKTGMPSSAVVTAST